MHLSTRDKSIIDSNAHKCANEMKKDPNHGWEIFDKFQSDLFDKLTEKHHYIIGDRYMELVLKKYEIEFKKFGGWDPVVINLY